MSMERGYTPDERSLRNGAPDRKVTTTITGRSERDHQTRLAGIVKSYDGRTVNTFPSFIRGLAQTGEFHGMRQEAVLVPTKDGEAVATIRPEDAALTGKTTDSEMMNYLADRLLSIQLPPSMDKEDSEHEQILRCWEENKGSIQSLLDDRRRRLQEIRHAHEDSLWGEKRVEFRDGKGEEYTNYRAEVEEVDKEYLGQFRRMLEELGRELESFANLPWDGENEHS